MFFCVNSFSFVHALHFSVSSFCSALYSVDSFKIADGAGYIVLINSLGHPVKFRRSFSCRLYLAPLALYVPFRSIKTMLLSGSSKR